MSKKCRTEIKMKERKEERKKEARENEENDENEKKNKHGKRMKDELKIWKDRKNGKKNN